MANHIFSDHKKHEEFKRRKCQIQVDYCQHQKVVATSHPDSPPKAPLSTPNAGPSVQPPVHNLNLVSTVYGIQVHKFTNILTWPNGLRTVTLTLVWDGKNLLEYDEIYVHLITLYPKAVPGGSHINFIDRKASQDNYDLVMAIRESLSIGHPVIIRNFEDTSTFSLNEDGLLHLFGISQNMLVNIHGTDLYFPHFKFTHPHSVPL